MLQLTVSPEFLSAFAAAVLALVFDWFPPVRNWFDTLTPSLKKQIMLAAVIAAAILLYGAQCTNLIVLAGYVCNEFSLSKLVYLALVAAGVNQGVHFLTKPSPELTEENPSAWQESK